ncbi:MAG: PQQ-like beta-propeller repeat protein [Spirochaetes bacterium]|nr:PQQ-like beta-propeller repeat protein [Spirochaetota bacterium]
MRATFPAILAFLASPLFPGDWPCFHGPERNGISGETGFNTNWGERAPKVIWTQPLSDRGYCGPSVSSNRVFIIDHAPNPDGVRSLESNILRAFDLATGRPLWSNGWSDPGGPLYGQARTTPTVYGGRVYTVGRWGLVSCFDAATGARQWSFDMAERYGGRIPEFRYSASPFFEGGRLILCPGGSNNPVAVDPQTGATLWKGDVVSFASGSNDYQIPSTYATPVVDVVDGRRQFILYLAQGLFGADLETGRQRWAFPWRTPFDTHASLPLVVGPHQILIGASYKQGAVLVHVSNSQATLGWSNGGLLMHFTSPILHKGFVYAVVDPERPGSLVCADPRTGDIRWRAEGFEKGAFLIADDLIIALAGKTGDLVLAKADPGAYTELGRLKNPLSGGGQNWSQPILADKKIVMRCLWRVGVIDLN